MQLTSTQLSRLRSRPHQANLFLSIYSPKTIMAARVVSGSYNVGDRQIAYDRVTTGSYLSLYSDLTVLVGSSAGSDDVGRIRMRSATGTYVNFAENSIVWQGDQYLTFIDQINVEAVYPRIIQDPNNQTNVIFYKDFDIPYSNQNTIYGTFVNMGSHRAGFAGSGTFFFSATGTVNVIGDSLTYNWAFEGGTPTGSTALTPGDVRWTIPGQYKVRLIVTSASGAVDTGYRYVSIYNRPSEGTNTPILRWELTELSGSRAEGGYNATFKIYDNIGEVQPNALIVIFSDNFYGSNRENIGGNGLNNSSIFFVGYIMKDSIKFNYEESWVEFSVGSVTEVMKEAEGFSISCESKAVATTWFELQEMSFLKAVYHYLRWQSTVLKVTDFQYTGDDRLVQYFDADRGSLYDSIDSFVRDSMLGELVSDRQGKLWAELSPFGLQNPFSSLPNYFTLHKQDWMDNIDISERRVSDMSFVELGGIAYYGVSSNSFSALLSNAPSTVPLYHGKAERHEGLILDSQAQLNQLAGNYLAHHNTRFSDVSMSLNGIYTNLDIAPQERLLLVVSREDTVRDKSLQNLSYVINSMEWRYSSVNQSLNPDISLTQIATGTAGQTVQIPVVPPDYGYSYPGLSLPPLPTFGTTTPVGSSVPSYIIFHDANKGLIYTDMFDSTNPQYITINGGLTQTQYQNANFVFTTPNGAVYAGRITSAPGAAFIAKAPYAGAPFSIVEDSTTLAAKYPTASTLGIMGVSFNPNVPETVAYVIATDIGSNLWISGVQKVSLPTLATAQPSDEVKNALKYSLNKWMLCAHSTAGGTPTVVWILSADGGSIGSITTIGSTGGVSLPRAAGQLGVFYILGSSFTGIKKFVNNDPTNLIVVSTDANLTSATGWSVEPSGGLFMMLRYGVGARGKSSDGGSSWSLLPNLPVGSYVWMYAGSGGTGVTDSRWVAAGAVVRFSPDFGNTWLNREGNITSIAPIPNINLIWVPGVSQ